MSQQASSLTAGTTESQIGEPGMQSGPPTGPGGPESGPQTSPGGLDAAKETAKAVGGQTVERAREVGDTAKTQARGVMDQIGGELRTQAGDQKTRLAAVIREISDELDQVQESNSGHLAGIAGTAASRGHEVSQWLEQHEPSDLIRVTEDFARRRPLTFLFAAATAGIVVGRMTRGMVGAKRDEHERQPYGRDASGYPPSQYDEYGRVTGPAVIDLTDPAEVANPSEYASGEYASGEYVAGEYGGEDYPGRRPGTDYPGAPYGTPTQYRTPSSFEE